MSSDTKVGDDALIERANNAVRRAPDGVIRAADKYFGEMALKIMYLRQVALQYSDAKNIGAFVDGLLDSITDVEALILRSQTEVRDAVPFYGNEHECVRDVIDQLVYQRDVMGKTALDVAKERDVAAQQLIEANRRAQSLDCDLMTATARLTRLTSRGALNSEVRARVFALTGGKCFYCDVALAMSQGDLSPDDVRRLFHLDHLVPKDAGGPDHESNFVPACGPCNGAKGAKSYLEFIRDRHPRLKLVVGGTP